MAVKKDTTDVKSPARQTGNADAPPRFSPAQVKIFLQEVQNEFRKIVWPERKVTLGLTGFVILLVVILSLYLGLVDLLLGKFVSSLLR